MAKCADYNLDPNQFPNLDSEGFDRTSAKTGLYNCIAWSMGEDFRFWSPTKQAQWLPELNTLVPYYWPNNVPFDAKLTTLQAMFSHRQYVVCASGEFECGYEKVAIYAHGDNVQHASKQLPDGKWSSKLGKNIDISHTLKGLEGPCYGQVVCVMRRLLVSTSETPSLVALAS